MYLNIYGTRTTLKELVFPATPSTIPATTTTVAPDLHRPNCLHFSIVSIIKVSVPFTEGTTIGMAALDKIK
jgi:hypothetical protein